MAKKKKKPAALLARYAELNARKHPRVSLDGKKLAPGKKRTRIRKAVKKAVRKVSPRTKHGDVRFNPTLRQRYEDAKRALKRGASSARVSIKKSLKKSAAIRSRHVELDGVVMSPGARRMQVIAMMKEHTKAAHGNIRWNPYVDPKTGRTLKVENIRGVRSAEALMKKAAKAVANKKRAPKLRAAARRAKAAGKPYKRLLGKAKTAKKHSKPFHGDVTKAGVHRTTKSASLRLSGHTANSPKHHGGKTAARSTGVFEPLVILGMA